MIIIDVLVGLAVGAGTTLFLILMLQKAWVLNAASNLAKLASDLQTYIQQRMELQHQVAKVRHEIDSLRGSVLQLVRERDAMEAAWETDNITLESTKCVDASEAIIFGRGREWVYAYTFPAHEKLARARNDEHFPIKVGMSTQDNVVTRVHQQVAGTSTAISERARLMLVFRVNESRDFEAWLHSKLDQSQRAVTESVGVEWFHTNSLEIERLFRSYVLTRPGPVAPVPQP
ncbi:MAG: GIY-YIG nuclease family protein [Planctomycetota bacterium]